MTEAKSRFDLMAIQKDINQLKIIGKQKDVSIAWLIRKAIKELLEKEAIKGGDDGEFK
jgi:hypothetical protein